MTGEAAPPGPGPDDEEGVVVRPEPVVLPGKALIPEADLRPPPRRLTHELVADTPYWYEGTPRDRPADGVLRAGTRVAVVDDGPAPTGVPHRRVTDAGGLSVEVPATAVRPLASGR